MSELKQLIHSDSKWVEKVKRIRDIVEKNPKELKDLDSESVTKELRDAVVNHFDCYYIWCKEIIEAIMKFGTHADPLYLAIIEGNLQLTETLLKNCARLDGPEWSKYSLAQFVF